jgi:hypothetical protein
MAVFELGSQSGPRRRATWSVLGVLTALLALWALAYFSGVFPWLGYAWQKRDTFGVGPITVVGEDRAGARWGVSTFAFLKGQEIVVDYDADIRAGSLRFYVYDMTKSGQGAGAAHFVTETGAGVWTYRVPQTGVYAILIEPSVLHGVGRGYDVTYSVWWGARWAS